MIVVTTPTGSIGSQTVRRLLAAQEEVRVIVRSASRLPPDVREAVDVVEGSHDDPAVLGRALQKVDALLWVVPPNPTAHSLGAAYLEFSQAAIEAMADGKVGRVVGVSALGRGTRQATTAGHVTATLELDDRIVTTGVAYRALTMPSFMDNIARQAALIRDLGTFTSPIPGKIKAPVCATADVAAVAAALLTDDTWTGSEEVPILGPADLSFDDMAHVLTEVLGKPVAYRQVTGPEFVDAMTARGISTAMANGLLDMAIAKAHGLDSAVQRTSAATTPTTFRDWCTDALERGVFR